MFTAIWNMIKKSARIYVESMAQMQPAYWETLAEIKAEDDEYGIGPS